MTPPEGRDRLYELLPAYLRYRDQSDPLDSPLRALMSVLEYQYDALERDIRGLYDDWFIETCQDWVAPLLGDLVGVSGIDERNAWLPSQRTRIANALSYRRLKGTLSVLERVARDVTGWSCVGTGFRHKLAATRCMEHLRVDRGGTVDVRDEAALERFEGPFDESLRSPQISGRHGLAPCVGPGAGYNLPYLGLYFWRLRSYPVRRRTARKVSPGCYTFHPLGVDQPLFSVPGSPGQLTERVGEGDVPGPVTRKALARVLAARRDGTEAGTDHLGTQPIVEIVDPRSGQPVPWESVAIGDLSEWRRPAAAGPDGPVVLLDPELGRFAFAEDHPAGGDVRVSHSYGLAGDLGGGPYERSCVTPSIGPESTTGAPRAAEEAAASVSQFDALQAALDAWPAAEQSAVIQIADSATYGGWSGLDLEIFLRQGSSLTLEAAPGAVPCFIGDLRVVVEAGAATPSLQLDGLLLGGKVIVTAAAGSTDAEHRLELGIRHCTVGSSRLGHGGPAADTSLELDVDSSRSWRLAVVVESSILGAIAVPDGAGRLEIRDSIVDAGSGLAISADGGSGASCPVEILRSTVFGRLSPARISAEDSIFTGALRVDARNLGGLRHCYVAEGSRTPQRSRCQPSSSADGQPEGAALAPAFSSRTYGQPGYAQLARRCPREIRSGATDGSEMGAFAHLRNPFREANLAGILEEYLPWGLEPRIFHVT